MITREEMIQEAVYRMKLINIIPEAIRQFTESTQINMSEPPMAALYWANREDRKRIKELEEEQTERAEAAGAAAKAEGEKFLAQVAKDPAVKMTKSGLMYKVLQEGSGRKPKATDTVRCHYEGTFADGSIFDSSYKRGEPAEFPLDGVIKGWTEGLQLMAEGAKYELYLPYNLAYGERGAGSSIPPYCALKFVVELIKVL